MKYKVTENNLTFSKAQKSYSIVIDVKADEFLSNYEF